ncbi:hypothetical protein BY996DRAFT_6416940 [Phakopsora pachyrhizi]|nr:hypothetical protein BY996DRAFT_6416940 [Phakopsora pachyrhizi]
MGQPPRAIHSLVNEENRTLPPVRLYPSQHRVSMTRYATSTDPRGYIPVFEYPLNGQYIMIDCETGMVHFTGIWKALGHTKADVVKLVESDPTIAPYLRKVRGGYLKIQGTWLPFETAQTLARRVAWQVRYDLIPLFGPEFPDTCLGPGEPGFGQLLLSAPKPRGRRGAKKSAPSPSTGRVATPLGGQSTRASGQHTYKEPGRTQATGITEPAGSLHSYNSTVSQARYSPYTRPPSHGITQLEPLPSLLQPGQSRPSQPNDGLYNNYKQSERTQGAAVNNGTFPLMNNYLIGSPVVTNSSVGNPVGSPLPPMQNNPANSSHNNFFETYTGPDSFEALSNRWLAAETNDTGNISDQPIFNCEGADCMPRMQYPNYVMLRKEAAVPTINDYSFPQHLDPDQIGAHRASSQPSAVSRGYAFDHPYDSGFHQSATGEPLERRSSSSPGYQMSNAGYDGSITGNSSINTKQDCPPQAKPTSYIESQGNTNGNVTYSPGSHSSYNPLKSPSPSSASTSTHLNHSYHRPSHSSSQNTLGGFSGHNGSDIRTDDMNQFSVLTSPAHLDLEASRSSITSTIQHSESDWNSGYFEWHRNSK